MIRGDKMLYSIIVWYYIMLQTILFCVACPRSQPVLHHQHKRGRLQPRDQAAHRTPLLAGPLPALSCRAYGCDGGATRLPLPTAWWEANSRSRPWWCHRSWAARPSGEPSASPSQRKGRRHLATKSSSALFSPAGASNVAAGRRAVLIVLIPSSFPLVVVDEKKNTD